VSEYVRILLDSMRRAHALAGEKLLKCSQRMKKDYDVKVNEKQFSPGQLVWVFNPRIFSGRCPKWERRYQRPYLILEKMKDVNYRIQKRPGQKQAVVHVDKLKPVLNANVSVMYRTMFKCPNCEYAESRRRSMTRHSLGHHGAEGLGPGQPLRLVPMERAAEAGERLPRLRLNSRQRWEERNCGGPRVSQRSSPASPAPSPASESAAPAPALARRPAWKPPSWSPRCTWTRRTVSPTSSSSDDGDGGDPSPELELPELSRQLPDAELWGLEVNPDPRRRPGVQGADAPPGAVAAAAAPGSSLVPGARGLAVAVHRRGRGCST